jgi:hypothetical protein
VTFSSGISATGSRDTQAVCPGPERIMRPLT